MNALPEPSREELDAALEREIETAHRAYLRAVELDDTPSVRECFDAMSALVAQRSCDRVSVEMEAERGSWMKALLMWAYGSGLLSFETTERIAACLRRSRWFRES